MFLTEIIVFCKNTLYLPSNTRDLPAIALDVTHLLPRTSRSLAGKNSEKYFECTTGLRVVPVAKAAQTQRHFVFRPTVVHATCLLLAGPVSKGTKATDVRCGVPSPRWLQLLKWK